MTHCHMVIHSCDKFCINVSKEKKAVAQRRSHIKNPINLILRSKVNNVFGLWMYATHCLVFDRSICQIWYANVKAWGTDQIQRHLKNSKILNSCPKSTLYRDHECTRHTASWWYTRAKYCMSMSKQNKRPTGLNGHLSIRDFTLTSCNSNQCAVYW